MLLSIAIQLRATRFLLMALVSTTLISQEGHQETGKVEGFAPLQETAQKCTTNRELYIQANHAALSEY